ncbi:MAG: DUF2326 domain-containing protein [Proteobacteria bacterium]|nr:DUF2326 domain-containing protein [Pseudomonadota bacterium]
MYLVSLKASEKSFKPIEFNSVGASFILAKQDNPEQNDNSKTYNGVGKSLLIALIDYCLGASTRNKITQSLHNSIPNWHFILKVKINNLNYEIIRHTNNPKHILLNTEELTIKDFCNKMEKLCFNIPSNFKFLSYRSLLPFFIRTSKQSYINYDEPFKVGSPYQKQLYNAFLLGLDVTLSQNKMQLKKGIDEINKSHKNIKDDPILSQFFYGNKDSTLALVDLDEKITQLELDLKQFEVADDYYQVKEDADAIKVNIDEIQNQIYLKKINVENINKSLKISPDVSREVIQNIYTQSKLVFQQTTEKQLSDLEQFYYDLTINRTKRLESNKKKINTELNELEKRFTDFKTKLDNNLKFLGAHQALDVFTKINTRLADFKQQKEKLKGFEQLQHDYELKKTSLSKDFLIQSENTSNYLENIKLSTKNIMEYFRTLVKKFYPNSLAGITIHNNDGKNQIRYNIEAKIQSDSSDGINSVKLFCYDLTLLLHGNNHTMGFIFHDSRLFSDIDETHCNELFNIIKSRFNTHQYIASINQNQLNSLSPEVRQFVEEHTVQILTDDSDSGKLLGVTVELEYD